MAEQIGNVIESKAKLWDEDLYATWEAKRDRKRKRTKSTGAEGSDDNKDTKKECKEEDINKLMVEMGLPTAFKSTKKIFKRDKIIERFQEHSEEIERDEAMFDESLFDKFWKEKGYQIALKSWMTKYSKYISSSEESSNEDIGDGDKTVEAQNSEKEIDLAAPSISKNKEIVHEDSWNSLWQEHYNRIWGEYHDSFTCYGIRVFDSGYDYRHESQSLVDRDSFTSSEQSSNASPELNQPRYHTEGSRFSALKLVEPVGENNDVVDVMPIFGETLEQSLEERCFNAEFYTAIRPISPGLREQIRQHREDERGEADEGDPPPHPEQFDLMCDEAVVTNVGIVPVTFSASSSSPDMEGWEIVAKRKKRSNKKRKKKPKIRASSFSASNHDKREPTGEVLEKYWCQRYRLFSLFDRGIILDQESWYSVTPERIADHIASRMSRFHAEDWTPSIIIDAFCGSGGNTIQFAKYCDHVIAIDIDPAKIELAKHNAGVYQVDKQIDFIVGDYLQVIKSLKRVVELFKPAPSSDVVVCEGDASEDEMDDSIRVAVFMSPPWGGPEYLKKEKFDLNDMTPNGLEIIKATREHLTSNIAILLPRNVDHDQLIASAGDGNKIEIEKNVLNGKVKTITAYYGELIQTKPEEGHSDCFLNE